MSILKKGIAFLMSAMLILPTIPVSAAQADDSGKSVQKGETLSYNLGSAEVELLSPDHKKITWDKLTDGKDVYVIEAEDDAFFPYEVQFTYNGKTTKEWFLSQDDIVDIGDYRFGIHSDATGTMVTQMTLDVAGKEVTVYPEEKEFTSGKQQLRSLMPLEEKPLYVDLRGFTPVELTRVSLASIFAGETEIDKTKNQVSFKRLGYNEDFKFADFSENSYLNANSWGSSMQWEMIVGSIDQLDASNVRYLVTGDKSYPEGWLDANVYLQNEDGTRSIVENTKCDYYLSVGNDYDRIYISIPRSLNDHTNIYYSFQLSEQYAHKTIRAYKGKCVTEEELSSSQDITAQVFSEDMTQADAGCLLEYGGNRYITLVTLDESNKITGIRPVLLYRSYLSEGPRFEGLYKGNQYAYSSSNGSSIGNTTTITFNLYKGNPADAVYDTYANFYVSGSVDNTKVTAAFIGTYNAIAEAEAAGKTNIKEQLFDSGNKYGVNLCNGMDFTFFIGEDGSENQEIYYVCLKVTEVNEESAVSDSLHNGTAVNFYGLNNTNAYCVPRDMDSYGNYNFRTILVKHDVDVSSLVPLFTRATGVNLYAAGGSVPEESGQSVHDFSDGMLQYTASAENGSDSANYWLQVVKQVEGVGQLYMNSLADPAAKTKTENGIVYSTREMLIDSLHDNRHDILLANIGTEAIQNLGLEITSNTVELDRYWTLSGDHELAGFSTTDRTTSYGQLPNLAMLRLKLKDGVADGTDITGTLTIKSGDTQLMVITLTGTAGNPSITTKEVPQAVKYVPYGTMIQNSNKYSWNKTTYELVSGTLPAGMELKENGELYGVPKEMGTFTFKVKMKNSYSGFSDSEKELSLTIQDNTDSNVEAATDEGYEVSTRIADVSENDTAESYLFVSEGLFDQFTDIYIDGDKLTKDTDYSAESGSTRITIKSETMKKLNNGTHTIGVEFRTEAKEVKRAAQNVKVQKSSSNNNPGSNTENNSNNNSSNNSSNSSTSDGNTGKDTTKKPEESKEPVTAEPEEPETNSDIEKAVNAKKRIVTKKTVNKTKKTMVSWLDKSGKPIKNSFVITPKGNLVYVDKKGVMKQGTGFAFNGKRYYASKSGVIVKNGFFETERGNTVYATKSGELKAKTVFKIKGKQYVAKKSGALAKNRWYTIGKKKYYCDKNGIVKKVKEL